MGLDVGLPQLLSLGVKEVVAQDLVVHLNAAMAAFQIDSPQRCAAFLGQCVLECTFFQRLKEDMTYTTVGRLRAVFPSLFRTDESAAPYVRNATKLANFVYAGRNGNGDVDSGDGSRFIGRGALGTTGRANYAKAADGCNRPYISAPELLEYPQDGCLAAAFFWHDRALNDLADTWSISDITKRINGPSMQNAALRLQYSLQALSILQPAPPPTS